MKIKWGGKATWLGVLTFVILTAMLQSGDSTLRNLAQTIYAFVFIFLAFIILFGGYLYLRSFFRKICSKRQSGDPD